MIRKLNDTHCQVLHRKTTHAVMLEAIEGLSTIKPEGVLDLLLKYETWLLSDMEHALPAGVKHPKLNILILIAGEFSYYNGFYHRRKLHSDNGADAYTHVQVFIGEYLSKL